MRESGDPRRAAQAGTLRKTERQEEEESHSSEETSVEAGPELLFLTNGYRGRMGLKTEIQDAMKVAMKGGDRLALSTLRLLLSALHNEEIKERRELTPEEVLKTISSLCKQRQEAIEYFRKGRRNDLVEKEEAELGVLRRFLPRALSEEEIRALIRSSIDEVGAKGVQDLGRVMKQLMPKVVGRTEGKRASELAKEFLSG